MEDVDARRDAVHQENIPDQNAAETQMAGKMGREKGMSGNKFRSTCCHFRSTCCLYTLTHMYIAYN